MSGYVNRDHGGWTELRVHGVSGTPPESMLEHPHVTRVAGDADAGFYRRVWESSGTSGDTKDERLEAYSWGGLTAGSGQRALWLLLTPFLLVNVAFWALPYAGMRDKGIRKLVRRAGERFGQRVQRLFALSVTLTLILAVISVSMDLIGWQCVRPSSSCAAKAPWLGFLSWSWLDLPGQRLSLAALVPLAVVGLLWWLANKTWRQTETAEVPAALATPSQKTPLENRKMWNGTAPVRRLRAVHIAASFSVIGIFLLVPFAGDAFPLPSTVDGLGTWLAGLFEPPATVDGLPTWLASLFFVLSVGLLGLAGVLVLLPQMTDRDKPGTADDHTERFDLYTVLPWLSLGVTVAAAVVLWWPGVGPGDPAPAATRTSLPWFAPAVEALSTVQTGLLAVMFLLLLVLNSFRGKAEPPEVPAGAAAPSGGAVREAPTEPPAGKPVPGKPAWWGLTTVVLMMMASALASAFAAGLGLAVAHVLGRPAPADTGPDAFVVPVPYLWGAALSVPVALSVLVAAGIAWLSLRLRARTMLGGDVDEAYPLAKIATALKASRAPANAATLRRARRIAHGWSRSEISDVGRRALGAFIILLVLWLGAGLVLYVADRNWVYDNVRWAVNVGDVLVGGFVLGLLYVGRQAYRNPKFRRSVGVLWDVGTFWPRATHPLAPPCYAERTVPDLINRIHHLGHTSGGHVVLSCHSQGSVIGAAVVMQLAYEESRKVALLTYGSPLSRLYARFFPAYLGPAALARTGAFLLGSPDEEANTDRRKWPWRNLYRLSDPIGGPVFVDFPATEISTADRDDELRRGDNKDVDRRLVDPAFAKLPGDTCYPPTLGHSSYPDDRAYPVSVKIVRELRGPAPPAADPGAGAAPGPAPVTAPGG